MQLELTDDRSRVDLAQLLDLHRATWWAHDRSREQVKRALENSRPSQQCRGIGAALMHHVLDHPDLKSVTQFLLLTADKHSFYERLGFRPERDMAMSLRR